MGADEKGLRGHLGHNLFVFEGVIYEVAEFYARTSDGNLTVVSTGVRGH